MDSEYWSRLLFNRKVIKINIPMANFRWHSNSKTINRVNKYTQAHEDAKKEDLLIRQKAYNLHSISKIIPFKYSFGVYFYYKIVRLLKMFFKGHYGFLEIRNAIKKLHHPSNKASI